MIGAVLVQVRVNKDDISNGIYRGEKKDVEIDQGLNFYS